MSRKLAHAGMEIKHTRHFSTDTVMQKQMKVIPRRGHLRPHTTYPKSFHCSVIFVLNIFEIIYDWAMCPDASLELQGHDGKWHCRHILLRATLSKWLEGFKQRANLTPSSRNNKQHKNKCNPCPWRTQAVYCISNLYIQ